MKYLFILLCFVFISCGAPKPYQSNTTLVVEYEGKEEYRRDPSYIGESKLRKLADSEKEYIVIYAAEWCRACKLTRKALNQANLQVEIYYINMNEKWVKELAAIMDVRSIPDMIHVGKDKQTVARRRGAGQIVTYLVSRF